jgi:UDP-3-O-[3-hydroxymyristoyl] glucosamine N-acyltransferase
MTSTVFFRPNRALTIADIADIVGVPVPDGADGGRVVRGIAPLDRAGPDDLVFLDNPRYAADAELTAAAVCIVGRRHAARVAKSAVVLVAAQPYRAFAQVAAAMFPQVMRPTSLFGATGVSPGSFVHADARLETGVIVDPGAVIGPGVEIGSGTVICANAVIGPGVKIGRNGAIGPGASVTNALIGNQVIIHGGTRIGTDGFGYAMGSEGHAKVPQIGRVVIQDNVEIGSNSCIDRGANRDTIIGEGTKIDNLVQIGHNVVIGRHCVIVALVGISGSTTLEDYVVLGGQVGVVGHVRIGMGAQIAGSASIAEDVPAGQRWGGTPARPLRQWAREVATLAKLAKRGTASEKGEDDGSASA